MDERDFQQSGDFLFSATANSRKHLSGNYDIPHRTKSIFQEQYSISNKVVNKKRQQNTNFKDLSKDNFNCGKITEIVEINSSDDEQMCTEKNLSHNRKTRKNSVKTRRLQHKSISLPKVIVISDEEDSDSKSQQIQSKNHENLSREERVPKPEINDICKNRETVAAQGILHNEQHRCIQGEVSSTTQIDNYNSDNDQILSRNSEVRNVARGLSSLDGEREVDPRTTQATNSSPRINVKNFDQERPYPNFSDVSSHEDDDSNSDLSREIDEAISSTSEMNGTVGQSGNHFNNSCSNYIESRIDRRINLSGCYRPSYPQYPTFQVGNNRPSSLYVDRHTHSPRVVFSSNCTNVSLRGQQNSNVSYPENQFFDHNSTSNVIFSTQLINNNSIVPYESEFIRRGQIFNDTNRITHNYNDNIRRYRNMESRCPPISRHPDINPSNPNFLMNNTPGNNPTNLCGMDQFGQRNELYPANNAAIAFPCRDNNNVCRLCHDSCGLPDEHNSFDQGSRRPIVRGFMRRRNLNRPDNSRDYLNSTMTDRHYVSPLRRKMQHSENFNQDISDRCNSENAPPSTSVCFNSNCDQFQDNVLETTRRNSEIYSHNIAFNRHEQETIRDSILSSDRLTQNDSQSSNKESNSRSTTPCVDELNENFEESLRNDGESSNCSQNTLNTLSVFNKLQSRLPDIQRINLKTSEEGSFESRYSAVKNSSDSEASNNTELEKSTKLTNTFVRKHQATVGTTNECISIKKPIALYALQKDQRIVNDMTQNKTRVHLSTSNSTLESHQSHILTDSQDVLNASTRNNKLCSLSKNTSEIKKTDVILKAQKEIKFKNSQSKQKEDSCSNTTKALVPTTNEDKNKETGMNMQNILPKEKDLNILCNKSLKEPHIHEKDTTFHSKKGIHEEKIASETTLPKGENQNNKEVNNQQKSLVQDKNNEKMEILEENKTPEVSLSKNEKSSLVFENCQHSSIIEQCNVKELTAETTVETQKDKENADNKLCIGSPENNEIETSNSSKCSLTEMKSSKEQNLTSIEIAVAEKTSLEIAIFKPSAPEDENFAKKQVDIDVQENILNTNTAKNTPDIEETDASDTVPEVQLSSMSLKDNEKKPCQDDSLSTEKVMNINVETSESVCSSNNSSTVAFTPSLKDGKNEEKLEVQPSSVSLEQREKTPCHDDLLSTEKIMTNENTQTFESNCNLSELFAVNLENDKDKKISKVESSAMSLDQEKTTSCRDDSSNIDETTTNVNAQTSKFVPISTDLSSGDLQNDSVEKSEEIQLSPISLEQTEKESSHNNLLSTEKIITSEQISEPLCNLTKSSEIDFSISSEKDNSEKIVEIQLSSMSLKQKDKTLRPDDSLNTEEITTNVNEQTSKTDSLKVDFAKNDENEKMSEVQLSTMSLEQQEKDSSHNNSLNAEKIITNINIETSEHILNETDSSVIDLESARSEKILGIQKQKEPSHDDSLSTKNIMINLNEHTPKLDCSLNDSSKADTIKNEKDEKTSEVQLSPVSLEEENKKSYHDNSLNTEKDITKGSVETLKPICNLIDSHVIGLENDSNGKMSEASSSPKSLEQDETKSPQDNSVNTDEILTNVNVQTSESDSNLSDLSPVSLENDRDENISKIQSSPMSLEQEEIISCQDDSLKTNEIITHAIEQTSKPASGLISSSSIDLKSDRLEGTAEIQKEKELSNLSTEETTTGVSLQVSKPVGNLTDLSTMDFTTNLKDYEKGKILEMQLNSVSLKQEERNPCHDSSLSTEEIIANVSEQISKSDCRLDKASTTDLKNNIDEKSVKMSLSSKSLEEKEKNSSHNDSLSYEKVIMNASEKISRPACNVTDSTTMISARSSKSDRTEKVLELTLEPNEKKSCNDDSLSTGEILTNANVHISEPVCSSTDLSAMEFTVNLKNDGNEKISEERLNPIPLEKEEVKSRCDGLWSIEKIIGKTNAQSLKSVSNLTDLVVKDAENDKKEKITDMQLSSMSLEQSEKGFTHNESVETNEVITSISEQSSRTVCNLISSSAMDLNSHKNEKMLEVQLSPKFSEQREKRSCESLSTEIITGVNAQNSKPVCTLTDLSAMDFERTPFKVRFKRRRSNCNNRLDPYDSSLFDTDITETKSIDKETEKKSAQTTADEDTITSSLLDRIDEALSDNKSKNNDERVPSPSQEIIVESENFDDDFSQYKEESTKFLSANELDQSLELNEKKEESEEMVISSTQTESLNRTDSNQSTSSNQEKYSEQSVTSDTDSGEQQISWMKQLGLCKLDSESLNDNNNSTENKDGMKEKGRRKKPKTVKKLGSTVQTDHVDKVPALKGVCTDRVLAHNLFNEYVEDKTILNDLVQSDNLNLLASEAEKKLLLLTLGDANKDSKGEINSNNKSRRGRQPRKQRGGKNSKMKNLKEESKPKPLRSTRNSCTASEKEAIEMNVKLALQKSNGKNSVRGKNRTSDSSYDSFADTVGIWQPEDTSDILRSIVDIGDEYSEETTKPVRKSNRKKSNSLTSEDINITETKGKKSRKGNSKKRIRFAEEVTFLGEECITKKTIYSDNEKPVVEAYDTFLPHCINYSSDSDDTGKLVIDLKEEINDAKRKVENEKPITKKIPKKSLHKAVSELLIKAQQEVKQDEILAPPCIDYNQGILISKKAQFKNDYVVTENVHAHNDKLAVIKPKSEEVQNEFPTILVEEIAKLTSEVDIISIRRNPTPFQILPDVSIKEDPVGNSNISSQILESNKNHIDKKAEKILPMFEHQTEGLCIKSPLETVSDGNNIKVVNTLPPIKHKKNIECGSRRNVDENGAVQLSCEKSVRNRISVDELCLSLSEQRVKGCDVKEHKGVKGANVEIKKLNSIKTYSNKRKRKNFINNRHSLEKEDQDDFNEHILSCNDVKKNLKGQVDITTNIILANNVLTKMCAAIESSKQINPLQLASETCDIRKDMKQTITVPDKKDVYFSPVFECDEKKMHSMNNVNNSYIIDDCCKTDSNFKNSGKSRKKTKLKSVRNTKKSTNSIEKFPMSGVQPVIEEMILQTSNEKSQIEISPEIRKKTLNSSTPNLKSAFKNEENNLESKKCMNILDSARDSSRSNDQQTSANDQFLLSQSDAHILKEIEKNENFKTTLSGSFGEKPSKDEMESVSTGDLNASTTFHDSNIQIDETNLKNHLTEQETNQIVEVIQFHNDDIINKILEEKNELQREDIVENKCDDVVTDIQSNDAEFNNSDKLSIEITLCDSTVQIDEVNIKNISTEQEMDETTEVIQVHTDSNNKVPEEKSEVQQEVTVANESDNIANATSSNEIELSCLDESLKEKSSLNKTKPDSVEELKIKTMFNNSNVRIDEIDMEDVSVEQETNKTTEVVQHHAADCYNEILEEKSELQIETTEVIQHHTDDCNQIPEQQNELQIKTTEVVHHNADGCNKILEEPSELQKGITEIIQNCTDSCNKIPEEQSELKIETTEIDQHHVDSCNEILGEQNDLQKETTEIVQQQADGCNKFPEEQNKLQIETFEVIQHHTDGCNQIPEQQNELQIKTTEVVQHNADGCNEILEEPSELQKGTTEIIQNHTDSCNKIREEPSELKIETTKIVQDLADSCNEILEEQNDLQKEATEIVENHDDSCNKILEEQNDLQEEATEIVENHDDSCNKILEEQNDLQKEATEIVENHDDSCNKILEEQNNLQKEATEIVHQQTHGCSKILEEQNKLQIETIEVIEHHTDGSNQIPEQQNELQIKTTEVVQHNADGCNEILEEPSELQKGTTEITQNHANDYNKILEQNELEKQDAVENKYIDIVNDTLSSKVELSCADDSLKDQSSVNKSESGSAEKLNVETTLHDPNIQIDEIDLKDISVEEKKDKSHTVIQHHIESNNEVAEEMNKMQEEIIVENKCDYGISDVLPKEMELNTSDDSDEIIEEIEKVCEGIVKSETPEKLPITENQMEQLKSSQIEDKVISADNEQPVTSSLQTGAFKEAEYSVKNNIMDFEEFQKSRIDEKSSEEENKSSVTSSDFSDVIYTQLVENLLEKDKPSENINQKTTIKISLELKPDNEINKIEASCSSSDGILSAEEKPKSLSECTDSTVNLICDGAYIINEINSSKSNMQQLQQETVNNELKKHIKNLESTKNVNEIFEEVQKVASSKNTQKNKRFQRENDGKEHGEEKHEVNEIIEETKDIINDAGNKEKFSDTKNQNDDIRENMKEQSEVIVKSLNGTLEKGLGEEFPFDIKGKNDKILNGIKVIDEIIIDAQNKLLNQNVETQIENEKILKPDLLEDVQKTQTKNYHDTKTSIVTIESMPETFIEPIEDIIPSPQYEVIIPISESNFVDTKAEGSLYSLKDDEVICNNEWEEAQQHCDASILKETISNFNKKLEERSDNNEQKLSASTDQHQNSADTSNELKSSENNFTQKVSEEDDVNQSFPLLSFPEDLFSIDTDKNQKDKGTEIIDEILHKYSESNENLEPVNSHSEKKLESNHDKQNKDGKVEKTTSNKEDLKPVMKKCLVKLKQLAKIQDLLEQNKVANKANTVKKKGTSSLKRKLKDDSKQSDHPLKKLNISKEKIEKFEEKSEINASDTPQSPTDYVPLHQGIEALLPKSTIDPFGIPLEIPTLKESDIRMGSEPALGSTGINKYQNLEMDPFCLSNINDDGLISFDESLFQCNSSIDDWPDLLDSCIKVFEGKNKGDCMLSAPSYLGKGDLKSEDNYSLIGSTIAPLVTLEPEVENGTPPIYTNMHSNFKDIQYSKANKISSDLDTDFLLDDVIPLEIYPTETDNTPAAKYPSNVQDSNFHLTKASENDLSSFDLNDYAFEIVIDNLLANFSGTENKDTSTEDILKGIEKSIIENNDTSQINPVDHSTCENENNTNDNLVFENPPKSISTTVNNKKENCIQSGKIDKIKDDNFVAPQKDLNNIKTRSNESTTQNQNNVIGYEGIIQPSKSKSSTVPSWDELMDNKNDNHKQSGKSVTNSNLKIDNFAIPEKDFNEIFNSKYRNVFDSSPKKNESTSKNKSTNYETSPPTSKLKSYPIPSWKRRDVNSTNKPKKPVVASKEYSPKKSQNSVQNSNSSNNIQLFSNSFQQSSEKKIFHMPLLELPQVDESNASSDSSLSERSTKQELTQNKNYQENYALGGKQTKYDSPSNAPLDYSIEVEVETTELPSQKKRSYSEVGNEMYPPKKRTNIEPPCEDLFDKVKKEPPPSFVKLHKPLVGECNKIARHSSSNSIQTPKIDKLPNKSGNSINGKNHPILHNRTTTNHKGKPHIMPYEQAQVDFRTSQSKVNVVHLPTRPTSINTTKSGSYTTLVSTSSSSLSIDRVKYTSNTKHNGVEQRDKSSMSCRSKEKREDYNEHKTKYHKYASSHREVHSSRTSASSASSRYVNKFGALNENLAVPSTKRNISETKPLTIPIAWDFKPVSNDEILEHYVKQKKPKKT